MRMVVLSRFGPLAIATAMATVSMEIRNRSMILANPFHDTEAPWRKSLSLHAPLDNYMAPSPPTEATPHLVPEAEHSVSQRHDHVRTPEPVTRPLACRSP